MVAKQGDSLDWISLPEPCIIRPAVQVQCWQYDQQMALEALTLQLPPLLDMQNTEALAGKLYLRPVSQQEHLHGQLTQTSSRDCTPSRWDNN